MGGNNFNNKLSGKSMQDAYNKARENAEEEYSSVKEVRAWYDQTTLKQAINTIKPTRKGYINKLAEESFKVITYNLKLPPNSSKPTSFKKAGNHPQPQWFRAEEKERDTISIQAQKAIVRIFICF